MSPGDAAWTYQPNPAADGGRAWTIHKISVSEMNNNVYLITSHLSHAQILIDAAAEAPTIATLVESQRDRLAQVLTTHQHWDHHRALSDVVQRFRCPTAAGAEDAGGLPVAPDRHLRHGDQVVVEELRLSVIGLRGHTPGSVAFALSPADSPDVIFTGDSLFPGGPGATGKPADFRSLMADLRQRIFSVFGDDTVVMPGHGDNTTLGLERPYLDEWDARGW